MNNHIDLQTNLSLERDMIKIEYQASNNKRRWDLHCHRGYEIYYFQSGSANYLINDKVYELKSGDMLVFNGELLHRVNPKEDTYIRSYINFIPELVADCLEEGYPEKVKKIFETENGTLIRWGQENQKDIEGMISKISEEKDSEETGYQTMIASYLTQLLVKIHRESIGINLESRNTGWTQKYGHVQRILSFINHNFEDHRITLDTIASSLHLNKYYMCHCFKEVTGFTINKYLGNRRIEESKQLLLKSELSITEIAARIGLKSTVQFSRLFKQYVGVSPNSYRRKYSEKELQF